MKAALRSLPWYLVGSILISPLILAVFTMGASLNLYWLYFAIPQWFLPLGATAGLLAWLIRQFIRAAFHLRSHRLMAEAGRSRDLRVY